MAEPEPSMEEILEMIRRNITEEGRARAARILSGRGSHGILDLTDVVADDGTVHHIDPPVDPPAATERNEPVPAASAPEGERAVGGTPLEREVHVAAGGRTLEDIVGDVLRPLVQAWLDENLPRLVERLAREQLARRSGE